MTEHWKPVQPGDYGALSVYNGGKTLEMPEETCDLPDDLRLCERVPDNRLSELSAEVDRLRQQVADLNAEYATQQAIHNAGLEHIEKAQAEAYDELIRLRALLPSAATRNALRRALVDAGWSHNDNAHVWAWLERLERP